MSGGELANAIAVLKALRAGPATMAAIAETTGIHWRAVYRLIDKLEAAGAPIERKELEREGPGSKPTGLHLTVAGLRSWLG